MRTLITSIVFALNIGSALCNGIGTTSFYFLPLKEVSVDRDALATYTPGGSVGVRTSEMGTIFSLTWEDSAITITHQDNNIEALKSDYGRFIDLAPEGLRKDITAAMECTKAFKVEVRRAGFPTLVHSARQIIICDKLNQLSRGFILTSLGIYYPDGRLICGEPTAPANLFFPPPRQ